MVCQIISITSSASVILYLSMELSSFIITSLRILDLVMLDQVLDLGDHLDLQDN